MEYIGIVEIGDNVLYIEKNNKYIYAGCGTNWGSAKQYKHKIDMDFSLDENLQAFIEYLEEYSK